MSLPEPIGITQTLRRRRFQLPPEKKEEYKGKGSGSVQIRVNRIVDGFEWTEIPVEYHNGEAWVAEDVGPFRQGQSITLTWEEDAEVRDELLGGSND